MVCRKHGTRWNIRCVIYDCDGVLLDSLEANRFFYNSICSLTGRGEITEGELRFVHTHTVHEAIRFLFPNDPHQAERALKLLPTLDPQKSLQKLHLEPLLLETLKILKEKGIRRAVNTNRSTSMKSIMDHFDLWPCFDLVVTALDVANPKPHPESIQKILHALEVKEDETVFVGDSEIDRQTAQAAGVRFIAYKNPALPAAASIQTHFDLLDLLQPGQNEGHAPCSGFGKKKGS
jgi:phosphoglycolate phosphatase